MLSADLETPQLRPPMKREVRLRLSVICLSRIQNGSEDVELDNEEDIVDDEDEDGEGGGYDDVESLHAGSFISATMNNIDDGDSNGYDWKPIERNGVELTVLPKAKTTSMHSSRTHTSQLPSTNLFRYRKFNRRLIHNSLMGLRRCSWTRSFIFTTQH
jgi:hypothetical protein